MFLSVRYMLINDWLNCYMVDRHMLMRRMLDTMQTKMSKVFSHKVFFFLKEQINKSVEWRLMGRRDNAKLMVKSTKSFHSSLWKGRCRSWNVLYHR